MKRASVINVMWIAILVVLLAMPANALQFSNRDTPREVRSSAQFVGSLNGILQATDRGLYRSSDHGLTWTKYSAPPSLPIAFDPQDDLTIYAGNQRSRDGGATWMDMKPDIDRRSFPPVPRAMIVDPEKPSTLYFAGDCGFQRDPRGGVYMSTDRGDRWKKIVDGCISSLVIDPLTPSVLYAGATSNGYNNYYEFSIGRSSTWNGTPSLPVRGIVPDPADPTRRYGLPKGNGLLVSTDSGATWSALPAPGIEAVYDLAIDPHDGRMLAAGPLRLFRSDDHGAHWEPVAGVPRGPRSILIDDDVVLVSTLRGVVRASRTSLDEWTATPIGEITPALPLFISAIALDPNDARTVFASFDDFYDVVMRSRDSGRHWERISGDDDAIPRRNLAVDAIGDLYSREYETLSRFSNATQSWESWPVPYEIKGTLRANPQRAGWLYASDEYSAKISIDGGHTWQSMVGLGAASSLAIAPNGSDLYAGNAHGVWASSDGGLTWRSVRSEECATRAIAVAASRPSTLYGLTLLTATRTIALFRSDDAGATWRALHWPGELNCCTNPMIVVDPADAESVWLGLLHSSDGGVTWSDESHPPLDARTQVAIDRNASLLHAVGGFDGLFTAPLRTEHRRAAGH